MREKVPEDDADLIEACIKRDLIAWSIFVKKYSDLIFISIENRLKKYGFPISRQEIEDIRQNTLASIWKGSKLKTVKNRKNVSYWLALVSGNEAITYMREVRRHETPKPVSIFDKLDECEIEDIIPSSKLNPKDELTNSELSKRLDETIGSLPRKEKLLIKLNLLHGKKYHEIARILNMPNGTVSSYIKRAKERLREDLKEFL